MFIYHICLFVYASVSVYPSAVSAPLLLYVFYVSLCFCLFLYLFTSSLASGFEGLHLLPATTPAAAVAAAFVVVVAADPAAFVIAAAASAAVLVIAAVVAVFVIAAVAAAAAAAAAAGDIPAAANMAGVTPMLLRRNFSDSFVGAAGLLSALISCKQLY